MCTLTRCCNIAVKIALTSHMFLVANFGTILMAPLVLVSSLTKIFPNAIYRICISIRVVLFKRAILCKSNTNEIRRISFNYRSRKFVKISHTPDALFGENSQKFGRREENLAASSTKALQVAKHRSLFSKIARLVINKLVNASFTLGHYLFALA